MEGTQQHSTGGLALPDSTLVAMGIRKIRDQRGWSVAQMATMMGVPKGAIQMWEAGTIKPGDMHMKRLEEMRNELIAYRSAKLVVGKRNARRMAKAKTNGKGR